MRHGLYNLFRRFCGLLVFVFAVGAVNAQVLFFMADGPEILLPNGTGKYMVKYRHGDAPSLTAPEHIFIVPLMTEGQSQNYSFDGVATFGSTTYAYAMQFNVRRESGNYLLKTTGGSQTVTPPGSTTPFAQGGVSFITSAVCPDVAYDYYLPGTSISGTRYVVFKDPTDSTPPTIIWEGVVGFGLTERVQGTAIELCGVVRVQRYETGNEDPWQDYTPLPPPDAPPSPPGPPPPPNPPDPPPAPPNEGGGSTPPTPPPPPTPPTGGGGGDGEIIEWVKDTNAVNRGISTRADVANEYLRQIRDNTEYAADRLKNIDEGTQIIADDVKRKQEQEQDIIEKTPSVEKQQQDGAAAGQAVQDAMGTLTSGNSAVSGSEPISEFTYELFGGFELDLNPFKEDRAGPLAAWIKALLAWWLVYKWFRWAMDKGFNAGTQAMIAPQARGNTVAAGTGGQATSLIAAVLITAIILSMITAIVAALNDTSLGGFTMSGVLHFNPFDAVSGIAAKIVWVMNQIFPISTLIAVLWNYLTFNWYIQGIAWVAMTLKRFIVP